MTAEEVDYLIRQVKTMSGIGGDTTVHLRPKLILPALYELKKYLTPVVSSVGIDYTAESHIA